WRLDNYCIIIVMNSLILNLSSGEIKFWIRILSGNLTRSTTSSGMSWPSQPVYATSSYLV
ncbi:hypothetical protein L9F63_016555, partial [Diploptera punctata]